MDREIYKQKFMEADSSRMPVSEFQKIINDSIYPAAGPQRGYNNLLIAIEECAELIESFGEYVSGNCRNDIVRWMSEASKAINMMLKSFKEEYAMVDKLMEERYQLETYLKEHGIIKNENTQEVENESDIER